MCLYSTKEIANVIGVSERTMFTRLKELKEEKKFTKKSKGKFYTPEEVLKIAAKLGLKIKLQNAA
jgi:hypothetical protein